MRSETFLHSSLDYQRIERALNFLGSNFRRQPSLQEVAASVHLSEFHFQRLFGRWVGISPKRFLQFLTKEYAKRLLVQSKNLLDVTYESGLSSPGRLHELFVSCEAVTPGEFKNKGAGLTIFYGFHPTPFGECLLAISGRGICGLSFVPKGQRQRVLASLRKKWLKANLREDPTRTHPLISPIFTVAREHESPLHLFLRGTNFQLKVWEALLRIPPGAVVSYADIAAHLGMPEASRAVGKAVAQNPIAFIIPCHRVIQKIGGIGGYQAGTARKMAILGWEAAKVRPEEIF